MVLDFSFVNLFLVRVDFLLIFILILNPMKS